MRFHHLSFVLALLPLSALAQAQSDGIKYNDLYGKGIELFSAGKFEEAEKTLRQALDLYDQDGQVWLTYGQAAAKAGHPDITIEAGKHVLDLGAFSEKTRANALFEMAKAYGQKKDEDHAWSYLEQAMNAGYRYLDRVRKDPNLELVHGHKGWEDLSATKDVSKMSRDEGWRYDLWLLDRELRRVHYAPYRYVSEKDRAAMVRNLSDRIPRLSDNEIIVEFMRYVASFGDGHTRISVPNLRRPPVQLFKFKEGIYVLAAATSLKDIVGKKLVAVEGQPVEQLVEKVIPFISRDNSQDILALSPSYITNPVVLNGIGVTAAKDKVKFTLENASGAKEDVEVACSTDVQPKADWAQIEKSGDILTLKNRFKPYWCQYLPELRAMYFQYNAVRDISEDPLTKFIPRMYQEMDEKKIDRLIIDNRWNGGGNTFLSQPIVLGLLQRPRISQQGNLYVITGRNTFSAAQNFTTDISRSCIATFVGEPTGSRPNFVGESIPYMLPYSKMAGTVSDLYWQRSWPMDDRMWIAPDIPAAPSWKAFSSGVDPAMAAIEELLKK